LAGFELSSAGITLRYAIEASVGVRPTSGYTILPGCKSIPDYNPEPNMLPVTDLSDEQFHRYIAGLRDIGGSVAFTFNDTDPLHDRWEQLIIDYEAARQNELAMWFAIVHRLRPKSFYFIGEPTPLGLSAITVDTVLEIDAYISPVFIHGRDLRPT